MRYLYQFIIPIAIIAIFIKWLSYRYMRMNKLRNHLEELYVEIEKALAARAKVVPEFLSYITTDNFDSPTIHQSIKSIEYIQKDSNFDYQFQQTTLSYQLNNIFIELNKLDKSTDARLLILRKQLTNIDEDIQYSAESFNKAAISYNEYLNSSPVKFYASQLGFLEAELFELQALNG